MNPLFAFRFDLSRGKTVHDVLMLFSATEALDPEAVATTIEDEIEQNLVPDELLIIVREPAFETTRDALSTNSLNVATLARLRDRATITLVGYNHCGKESSRTQIAGPARSRQVRLEDIRRRAVTRIFNTNHGFVESTPVYHFENPSERHTERFIRLSNILVRGAEIAFIAFCVLPFVPASTTVAYLDTPSLYAIVAAINEQRASFEDVETILADNFSSYAGIDNYPFTQLANAIVLISASSSGGLAQELVETRKFTPDSITHLLFLGTDKSGSNIVCDLHQDSLTNPDGIAELPAVEDRKTCRLCASGSRPIKLQGDQFEFAGPQQDPLLIAKSHAPAGLAPMMDRLAGGGIFGVGLGKTSGKHPRLYHVAASAMLGHPAFEGRLDFVLRRSLPASLGHVIAIDGDSVAFAETIARHAVSEPAVVRRDNLDAIERDTQSAIIIAASVIESGRAMLDISRDLRSIAPRAPLLYIVGLSKSSGEPRREVLERTLTQTVNPYPYVFIEVERMILPLSTELHAWAAELRLLIDPDVAALVPKQLKSVVDARIARLRRTSEALTDDLFVPNAPDRAPTLQPGFVFWPDGAPERAHSQADVFFTVASVLQQLRANAHRGGRAAIKSNWFQQTILAPENFGRFNDDIIQASILRAAYPYEMNFADSPTDSREMGRLIRRIVQASDQKRGAAAAEFLIALATHRLRLRLDDVEAAVSGSASGSELVELLRGICRARLLDADT